MQVVLILDVVDDVVLVGQPVVVWCAEIVCDIMGHNADFFGQAGNRCPVIFHQSAGKVGNFSANSGEGLGLEVLEFGEPGINIRFDASINQIIFV